MSAILQVFLLATLAQADPKSAQEAQIRARIDLLERDLARMTRELQDLRAKLGPAEPPPMTSELSRSLERAYRALHNEALDKELLLDAARLFERGDAKTALVKLRTGRHRAAVPLILQDMLRCEARAKFKNEDVADHLLTLELLTGENVESARGRSVQRFVAEWWPARQDKFITDIGKMSSDQVAHIARRLREICAPPQGYKGNGPSYEAHAILYSLFSGSDRPERGGPQPWVAEELHPALGPAFLAGMGYRAEGAGGQDVAVVPYQLVHILAEMRKQSAFPQLDKVAEDVTQNSAVRLVCLFALATAKEGVRVPALLSILAREKKLERRLAALECLYYADDLEPAADYLGEVLDDPNLEVQRSALDALGKAPPPRLFKQLKRLADAKHQEKVLQVIAAMGTLEAQQYLADYLAKTLDDRPKIERIYDALWAFQRSVNQSWVSAGTYPFEHYERLANKALTWWKENGGRGK